MGEGYSRALLSLVMQAGSSRRLYEMDERSMAGLKGISKESARIIVEKRKSWDPEKKFEDFGKTGIRFVPYYLKEYPEKLRRISGHPFALFVKGELPEDDTKTVAVIGARNCSEYGRRVASEFGRGLALAGVPVISGMAYGIDGIAQNACLDEGGRSYAVLGCGVDICYPESNRNLYNRLSGNGGIISEYPPGCPPKASLFPPRNRIISALSDLVIVVEARKRSGTLITVDMALEQGKDIAVVPGRITDPLSEGCVSLWKQGAIPVSDIEDITEIIGKSNIKGQRVRDEKDHEEALIIDGSENEKLIFSRLDLDPKSIEQIRRETMLETFELIEGIMLLRIKGLIREVGKDCYVRG